MAQDLRTRLRVSTRDALPEAQHEAQALADTLGAHGVLTYGQLNAVIRETSADTDLRIAACDAAAWLKDRRSTQSLLVAFQSEDPDLQDAATIALSLAPDQRATPAMLAALSQENDAETRLAAAFVLADLHDERAVAPLTDILRDAAEDFALRAQAAEAIGQTGSGGAPDWHVDARAALRAALYDPAPEVRYSAVHALALLVDTESLPALQRLAEADTAEVPERGSISEAAEDAIKWIQGEGAEFQEWMARYS